MTDTIWATLSLQFTLGESINLSLPTSLETSVRGKPAMEGVQGETNILIIQPLLGARRLSSIQSILAKGTGLNTSDTKSKSKVWALPNRSVGAISNLYLTGNWTTQWCPNRPAWFSKIQPRMSRTFHSVSSFMVQDLPRMRSRQLTSQDQEQKHLIECRELRREVPRVNVRKKRGHSKSTWRRTLLLRQTSLDFSQTQRHILANELKIGYSETRRTDQTGIR